MEPVVQYDQPFKHSDFEKSEQIKEENSEDTSEIMTQSHTETSKSSRSTSDDLLEVDPVIIPKLLQTEPPRTQEMSGSVDDDCFSEPLFDLPREMLTSGPFSTKSPSAQMMERLRTDVTDWSMVSNDSLFSIPLRSSSFSRDINGQIFKNSTENGAKKSLRVQWSDPNVKTYSFMVENQDTSHFSADFSVKKSSESPCMCTDCSSCSETSSCCSGFSCCRCSTLCIICLDCLSCCYSICLDCWSCCECSIW